MIQAECECGRVVKTKDENGGRTVNCPDCGEGITLPKPKRRASAGERAMEPSGGQLPPRRKVKRTKSAAQIEKEKERKKQKENEPGELDEKAKKTLDGATKAMFAVSGLVAACILGGAGYWVYSSGIGGSSGSAELPKEYVAFESENVDFTCVYPKGWDRTSGGGSGGNPQWARFKLNESIRIEIKQAISGSLVGGIAQTMGGDDPDPMAPVRTAHEFRRNQLKAGTDGYTEGPPEVVETEGFGPALLSTFEMKVWFSTDNGYRASVLAPSCQYNVTLFCPKDQQSRFKAVVKKIVESMG